MCIGVCIICITSIMLIISKRQSDLEKRDCKFGEMHIEK